MKDTIDGHRSRGQAEFDDNLKNSRQVPARQVPAKEVLAIVVAGYAFAGSQHGKHEATIRIMTEPVITLVCPTCKQNFPFKPARSSMPFCSQRCQMADLGKWLDEEIGLPHEASDEGPEAPSPPVVREWRFD